MKRRRIAVHEQPHRLHAGLQNAVLVTSPDQSGAGREQADLPHREPVPVGMGVPHGVRSAIVFVRDVRVSHINGKPNVFFCNSWDYRVLARSIRDGDDSREYPDLDRSFVSASVIPQEPGFYSARLRVSVNGSLNVAIEQFGDKVDQEVEALVPVTV